MRIRDMKNENKSRIINNGSFQLKTKEKLQEQAMNKWIVTRAKEIK